MKKTGIYVHIPFCKSKCGYCDFNSYAGLESMIAPYFSALSEEIRNCGEKCEICADTVYIGGGTPTCVDTDYLCGLMKNIFSSYKICDGSEITSECNPKTADEEKLRMMRRSGINRLSIGLQSTDDAMLRTLGRIHTFSDFLDCFRSARRAGFENISLDLMYGLPNQTISGWRETLLRAAELGAEHISCYALKLEDGTPLAAANPPVPDDDTVADMYDMCCEILARFGYERYEISNFAKIGAQSRHNLKYWRCDDFLGLGAGAFSCMNGARFSNEPCVSEYIKLIQNRGSAVRERSELTPFDLMSEFVFLGLRCADGISRREFSRRFGRDLSEVFGQQIKKYETGGFLISEGDRLRFSDKAFFVSNTILADFT